MVIDHVLCTEGTNEVEVAGGGSCRNVRAHPARQLDGIRANSACPTMYENALSRLDVGSLDHGSPGSEGAHRQCRGFFERESQGFGLHIFRERQGVLGITAHEDAVN